MAERIAASSRNIGATRYAIEIEPHLDGAFKNLRPLPRGDSEQLYQSFIRHREGEPIADLSGMLKRLPEPFRRLDLGPVAIDVIDFLLNYDRGRILCLIGRRGAGKSSVLHFVETAFARSGHEANPIILIIDANALREVGTTANAITEADFLILLCEEIRQCLPQVSPEFREALEAGLGVLLSDQTFAAARSFGQIVAPLLPDANPLRLVLAFDNLDHLDIAEAQYALELAKEIELTSRIGSILCLRPPTVQGLIERSAARSLFDYKVTVGPPALDEWLDRLPAEYSVAASAKGVPQHEINVLTTAMTRFVELLRQSSRKAPGSDAMGLLAALSADDTRTLARLLRRMSMHSSVPSDWLFTGKGPMPTFYPLTALLEGSQTSFAACEELPNLLCSMHHGNWDNIVQYHVLQLLAAGDGSAETARLLTWLQELGYDATVAINAIDTMHKAQLLESSNAELKFTVHFYPEYISLTASGVFYLRVLLREITYLSTVVTDVPLAHKAFRGEGDGFAARLKSVVEFLEVVKDAEQRHITTLVSRPASADLARVVASLQSGGLFTSVVLEALADVVEKQRNSDARAVREYLDEIQDEIIPRYHRYVDEMNSRMADISRRMAKSTIGDKHERLSTPLGPCTVRTRRLGLELHVSVTLPSSAASVGTVIALMGKLGENVMSMVTVVTSRAHRSESVTNGAVEISFHPVIDSDNEWQSTDIRIYEPRPRRRQAYISVDEVNGKFRLLFFELSGGQISSPLELGRDGDVKATVERLRAAVAKVEAMVLSGRNPVTYMRIAGKALADSILSPLGRERLLQASESIDTLVVASRFSALPWEWLTPGMFSRTAPMLVEKWEVIRWPFDIVRWIIATEGAECERAPTLKTYGLKTPAKWRQRADALEDLVQGTGYEVLHLVAHNEKGMLKLLDSDTRVDEDDARYMFVEGVAAIVVSACGVGAGEYGRNLASAFVEGSGCLVWAPLVAIREEDALRIDTALQKTLSSRGSVRDLRTRFSDTEPLGLVYARYGMYEVNPKEI